MDVYSRLMNIDEVVECLNRKTDTDISFDKKRVLTLIENKIIPMVFKFEGFVTWGCVSKGKYQYYSIKMNGYFNFIENNNKQAMEIFEGSLDEILLSKAIIYHLDSPDIRGGAPEGIKPEKGEIVSFKTGGRSPALTPDLTPYLTTEPSYPSIENSIKIYNNKVGVLKVDLENFINKIRNKAMDNKTQIEALESKIEKLESKSKEIKSENTNLRQQLEKLAADNIQIANLKNEPAQSKSDKRSYTTPAISIMDKVIDKFWVNYDPDQPAPKQSTITAWIIDNFNDISSALALNIDKVCRPDSAKSGGKYKR